MWIRGNRKVRHASDPFDPLKALKGLLKALKGL